MKTITMKRIVIFLLVTSISFSLQAQERRIINLPDIPGYQTLLCDFHMHTVFSDGYVWPTVRVDEAWEEGIDAIAITDHLEYLPHKNDISADHNRAWEIAQNYAKNKDVIVIAGTEITKGMPPGHFNALFIKDANTILHDDYKSAIGEAVGQGAFIIWNHPGWKRQQPDTMLWWDEHNLLLKEGWLHGIEVANGHEYYPEAINWARDKDLTFMANSDIHQPIHMAFDVVESHRPGTLVFVTERSEGGIREALFNGRTIAYYKNLLMGKEEILRAFLLESLFIKESPESNIFTFLNPTDIILKLKLDNKIYQDWSRSIHIDPGKEVLFKLPADSNKDEIMLSIENFLIGAEESLSIPLSSIRTIHQ